MFFKDSSDGGPVKHAFAVRLLVIALSFAVLVVARHLLGGFGYSLGYLYVTVVSLAGFWFGVIGGFAAAFVAAAILLGELTLFPSLIRGELVLSGLIIRIMIYFLSGVGLGYLSWVGVARSERIRDLDRMKTELLGIAAHDLRNPMQNIVLSTEILMDDAKEQYLTAEKRLSTAESISNSSKFMLSLVNDLLDVSKIESGHIDIRREPCDYLRMVEESVEMNRRRVAARGVEIRETVSGDIPEVSIDRDRIEEVLNNIIDNAIKFSKDGDTITVEVTLSEGEVLTIVADEGPGINDYDRARIFKPFYRASTEPMTKSNERSTGLGLSIAKSIVEAHGGRIWVESEPGRGSVFCFTIVPKGPSIPKG